MQTMTEDQLNALKIYIDAKISHAMVPVFDNEIMLMRAENQLDRAMLFEGASCGDAQGLPVGPKAGSRPAAPSLPLEGRGGAT